jgi:hypothetical protein
MALEIGLVIFFVMRVKPNNIYHGIKLQLFNIAQSDGGKSKRLPPLRVLARRFGCSAPTVLRAVRDLTVTNHLVPVPGGGYATVSPDSASVIRTVALLHGTGMYMYHGSYELEMKFYASNPLCIINRDIGIYEPNIETQGEFGRLIRAHGYAAVILSCPTPAILKETQEATSEVSIPLGVFGGDDSGGDASITFDVKKNYQEIFVELTRRQRCRALVLSCAGHPFNATIRSLLESCGELFETSFFYSGTRQELEDFTLNNIGGRGQNYDAVVFVANIRNLYDKLRSQAAKCLCVMPEFSFVREKNFRGLVLKYDLDTAGRVFADSMDALLGGKMLENPHGSIPSSLHEIE